MADDRNLKILLFADYSNFHATLAKGLRKRGCDVTVASDGSAFMECERDIDISRNEGKLGGLWLAARLHGSLGRKLSGFDIVSLRDPNCLNLRPERGLRILKNIMGRNSKCFLSYISTDIPFLDMLEAKDSPLKYSEWFINGKPNHLLLEDETQWEGWHTKGMRALNEYVYAHINGIVSGLYEYHKSAERVFPKEKIAYGGIPIDIEKIEFKPIDNPGKIRLFLGRDNRRKLQKGSDLLEIAASNVVAKYPDKAELIVFENRPRREYEDAMRSCHVLLDQIYSYTPATMALEGLAAGLTVVSGGEKEYYDFIGEKDNHPIINAPVELEALEKTIEKIVVSPQKMKERGIRGREFVEKHNSLDVVTERYLNFWLNH